MAAIVYDTGALLAAERRNPDFLALHDEVTAARIRPLVPVVVLAQAWRGGPQHPRAFCAFRAQERLHDSFHENDIQVVTNFEMRHLNCESPYGIEP